MVRKEVVAISISQDEKAVERCMLGGMALGIFSSWIERKILVIKYQELRPLLQTPRISLSLIQ